MSTNAVIVRPPETDDELYEFVKLLWGVTIPRTRVCPDHQTPFEAFADAYFARHPVAVWKASRGLGGKSRTLAYLDLTEIVVLGSQNTLLGGSGAQSLNVHEAMREGWDWEMAPRHMIKQETNIVTKLHNGGYIRALTASQRSVRGPHPQRLRLDEIDEMDQDILDAALGQPMPGRNKRGEMIDTSTVMSSTHQYADKTMTAMLRQAKERNWPIFHWCYKETSNPVDGWLSPDFIERKRQEVPARMWEIEYDLQEPGVGDRAFDTEAVRTMFSDIPDRKRSKYSGSKVYDAEYTATEEYTFQKPQNNAEYVTAADWAQTKDRTVVAVFKTTVEPMQLVYYYRGHRMPYPAMIEKFNKAKRRYWGTAIHDATGLGNVVKDYIEGEVENFIMAGRPRADMLTEYVAAVERGEMVAPMITSAFIEHKFCSVDDLYRTGQEFHLPDTVCAFALAWHKAGRKRRPIVVPAEMLREGGMSPWTEERAEMSEYSFGV